MSHSKSGCDDGLDDESCWLQELIDYNRAAKPSQPQHAAHQICNPWAGKLSSGILGLPRAVQCFAAINADPTIDCRLPKNGALTGAILTHACATVDSILREQGPAVYKIGYTHCPSFRMRNRLYGYVHDRHQKWQQMVVVYCSDEPVGPAFLEAALINKHKGSPGCRNERDGGESVQVQHGGPYFTYIIFQSFKRASTAPVVEAQS